MGNSLHTFRHTWRPLLVAVRHPSNQKRSHHADHSQFLEHVSEGGNDFSAQDLRVTSTENKRLRAIYRPDGLVIKLLGIPDSLV